MQKNPIRIKNMTTNQEIKKINGRGIHIIEDSLIGAVARQKISTTARDGKVWTLLGNWRVAGGYEYAWTEIPAIGTVLGTFGNASSPERVKVVSIGAEYDATEDVGVPDENHSYSGFRKTGERAVRLRKIKLEVL